MLPRFAVSNSIPYEPFIFISSNLNHTYQRETENHLFKWEDEALLDEIRLVDAKRLDHVHDVQSISKNVMDQLAVYETRMGEFKKDLDGKILKVTEEVSARTEAANTNNSYGLEAQSTGFDPQPSTTTTVSLHNIAVSVAVLGAVAWFYFKLA